MSFEPHVKRVAIVGAGIAGLALAEALKRRSRAVDVTVLEKSERAGGNIRSEVVDGYTCEWGPNGFLDNVPETLDLIRGVGLENHLQASDAAARRRFIYRGGKLHQVPGSPIEFIRSRVLSWPAKGRILLEPFARRRAEADESIHAFATRHLGREAADVLVDPMVSGVFGGDASQLSLRACFPRMWAMEVKYRSLFRATFALAWGSQRDGRKLQGTALPANAATANRTWAPLGAPSGRLTSFRGGMEDLIRALLDVLGDAVQVSCHVSTLDEHAPLASDRTSPAEPDGGFVLYVKEKGRLHADAVALTGSAHESAGIVQRLDPELARALAEIPTAPLAVVCLGYDARALSEGGVRLNGVGFLVPFGEGPQILGALWDSSIYPGRAPSGKALLRVMIGGARDPAAVELADEALIELVRRDLHYTMGIDIAPELVRIVRHRVGIPQYTEGHLDRLDRIQARLGDHAGLFLAGNSYRGVSINNCVAEAGPLADRILRSLDAC